jgi:hypothetical protein
MWCLGPPTILHRWYVKVRIDKFRIDPRLGTIETLLRPKFGVRNGT